MNFLESETTNGAAITVNLNQQAFNGSLGAIFSPSPQHRFYINTASGFRAPNVDDLGKFFEPSEGILVVPNTELEPEFTYNTEIGYEWRWRDRLTLGVVGYYTVLINGFDRRDFTFDGQDSIFF